MTLKQQKQIVKQLLKNLGPIEVDKTQENIEIGCALHNLGISTFCPGTRYHSEKDRQLGLVLRSAEKAQRWLNSFE